MDLDSGQQAGLSSLPWLVLDGTAEYLDRSDILALSYVCKSVRLFAERFYYTHYGVRVKDKEGFARDRKSVV